MHERIKDESFTLRKCYDKQEKKEVKLIISEIFAISLHWSVGLIIKI